MTGKCTWTRPKELRSEHFVMHHSPYHPHPKVLSTDDIVW